MSARRDNYSYGYFRQSASQQKHNWLSAQHRLHESTYRTGLKTYHQLAQEYLSLKKNPDQAAALVESDKMKAAMMFYFFNDFQLGEMIVDRYSETPHYHLALLVQDELHRRKEEQGCLQNILGMKSVAQTDDREPLYDSMDS